LLSARARTRRSRIRFAAANCYYVERWRQLPASGTYLNGNALSLTDSPDAWNYLDTLSRRSATTHVIVGDHDTVDMTGEHWRAAARTAENLELHVIKHAGHFSWIDQPAEFRRIINHALQL
jgi:pimeloyl-ACP methyl ester carboxylesterase